MAGCHGFFLFSILFPRFQVEKRDETVYLNLVFFLQVFRCWSYLLDFVCLFFSPFLLNVMQVLLCCCSSALH